MEKQQAKGLSEAGAVQQQCGGPAGGEGAQSCWEPSESWDWPTFKTCDLSGVTCTLNPSNTRGKKGAAGSSAMLFIFSLCKCLLNIS